MMRLEQISERIFGRPSFCMVCGGPQNQGLYCLCEDCLKALPITNGKVCVFCGREIHGSGLDTVCRDCLYLEKSHYGGICCTRYESSAAKLIFDFKYNDKRYIGKFLAQMMSDYLKGQSVPFDVVIPVPATVKRQRIRGFHHTLYMAEHIAMLQEKPLVGEALIRSHHTTRLKYLDREERIQEMKDAFTWTAPWSLEGAKVLLVDDILTTGATLSACTKVLVEAGAGQVIWATFSGVV